MSEQQTQGGTPPGSENQQGDQSKNIKEEFNRKLSNTEAQIAALKKANEDVLAKLTSLTAKPTKKEENIVDDLDSLMYTDPTKYAQVVEERAEKRIMAKIDQRQAAQTKQTSVVSELYSEYPELSDTNNNLTKKAVEIYASLPEEDKTTPMAYRLAVKEAALELGIKPKSKRSQEEYEDIGGGGNGGGPRNRPDRLDKATEDFARMMGLDTSDPKIKKNLIERSKRNWNRYE